MGSVKLSSTRFSLCIMLKKQKAPLDFHPAGLSVMITMHKLKRVLLYLPGVAAQVAGGAIGWLRLGWANGGIVGAERSRVLHCAG